MRSLPATLERRIAAAAAVTDADVAYISQYAYEMK